MGAITRSLIPSSCAGFSECRQPMGRSRVTHGRRLNADWSQGMAVSCFTALVASAVLGVTCLGVAGDEQPGTQPGRLWRHEMDFDLVG
jgi:hypothetical protein